MDLTDASKSIHGSTGEMLVPPLRDEKNQRSGHADVRNPMLSLPSIWRLRALPPEMRQALRAVLIEVRLDSRVRAQICWEKHKAPMAAYWKAVSVYAGHLARVLK